MGQKSNPILLRLGINKRWQSNWFSEKNYANYLHQDLAIRQFILKKIDGTGISKIDIERPGSGLKINIFAARPGLIVGRRGEELEKLKKLLTNKFKLNILVSVKEVRRAEIDATLTAKNISTQLEKRVAFRRAIKRAMQNVMRFNVGGCKIMVGGRLNGAEIARSEWVREGRVPLHTLKANIDYAAHEALTVYGLIGIKVWIYKPPQEFGKGKK